jgi:uncharacterized damage-inducible protein DinB
MPVIARPQETEFAPYFGQYIEQVPDGDLLGLLGVQIADTDELLQGLSDEQAGFRYAEGKWSVRQVVGHMADTERIFCYRALCFARSEPNPLPGFDENAYVDAANFDERTLDALLDELRSVRAATLTLFRGLAAEAFERRGIANQREYSVRAIPWIIAGHERHHVALLRERYLAAMRP